MIHVDEEFKALIPPLSREEYKQLEENCVKEGIRDPLVVWKLPGNEILIDGHNRWEISARHAGIPFNIVYKEFENREAVKEWIIKNQLGRRNIPPYVRAELALKLKPVIAERAKERQKGGQGGVLLNQNSEKANTSKELAKVAGVSHDTIHRVEVIKEKANELDPRTIEDLRRGDVSINKVYTDIIAMEHEDRRQREARELREAKERVKNSKAEKVVSIGEVKQNADDKKLIFKEFMSEVQKANEALRHVGYRLDLESNQAVSFAAIKAADKVEQIELQNELNHGLRTLLHIQKKVEEAINEK